MSKTVKNKIETIRIYTFRTSEHPERILLGTLTHMCDKGRRGKWSFKVTSFTYTEEFCNKIIDDVESSAEQLIGLELANAEKKSEKVNYNECMFNIYSNILSQMFDEVLHVTTQVREIKETTTQICTYTKRFEDAK